MGALRKRHLRVIAVLAASLLAAVAPSFAGGVGIPPYKLVKLETLLFYNDTGTFSPDIPAKAPLWNTIIGEGWAGKASNATFVRVTVSGRGGTFASGRSVRAVVREGFWNASGALKLADVVLDQRAGLPVLTRAGTTTLGFWVYETGCNPLRIVVTLNGQHPVPRMSRVIAFRCGE